MTDDPTTADCWDWERFPLLIDGVLDKMPTGETWRAIFALEPGLSVRPPDDEGFVAVLHDHDVVMELSVSAFRTHSPGGVARIMVNGAPQLLELEFKR